MLTGSDNAQVTPEVAPCSGRSYFVPNAHLLLLLRNALAKLLGFPKEAGFAVQPIRVVAFGHHFEFALAHRLVGE